MANQPKRVTFGEFKRFEFMLPEKKKDRNSCVVGAGHDFWKGHEILERRALRNLPAKTHALLALGRAVEMRAAVEEYMSEPVTQVPVTAVTAGTQGTQKRRGLRRPSAPNATVARSRRPPPPARQRSSSVGSREVRQVPTDKIKRSVDDQDEDVLPLLGEGLDASPHSDSDGDEDDETMALVKRSEFTSASADTSSMATSQAKRDLDFASHESFAVSQVGAAPGDGTDADTSIQKRIARHRFRAFTVADPSQMASSLRASFEAPLSPVPPSSGVDRSRPSFLLRRNSRSQTLPCMPTQHE
eukprot:TRINITY_DN3301_c0_g3_i1.p1 TRINITY_DN3301_c0_g3~~TRINITY_DN3301_c0_g3_i1.p1  ORF type:complete len:300 (-),score=41.21 TRINITY_DN3301_c0_g3_i1:453-1352(-)